VQELFRRLFGLGGPSSQQGQQQQRQQQQQQQRRQQQQQQQGQWQREAQRRPASGDPRDPDGYYKAMGVRPDATKDEIQVSSQPLLDSSVVDGTAIIGPETLCSLMCLGKCVHSLLYVRQYVAFR